MAKHGICGIIGGGSAEGGAVERHMIGFQAAYARRGIELELGERLALGFQFHIAKSREDGMSEAAKYYEENMKMFGELRLVRAFPPGRDRRSGGVVQRRRRAREWRTLDRRRSRCDRRDPHLIVVSWRRLAFNNPVSNR